MLQNVLSYGIAIATFLICVNANNCEAKISTPATDTEALERVLRYAAGHREFKNLYFKLHEQEFVRLAQKGQCPLTLFIGCSDSRVVPNLILSTKPGDLFVIRTAGNFVPPPDPSIPWDAVGASIQYAVEVLGIKDIIVCGHSQCGAIKGLFQDLDETKLDLVKKWLSLGEQVKKTTLFNVKENTPTEELYRIAEKVSVVYQLNNLMSYPFIKRRVDGNELYLHGWFFDIQSGQISYFDPQKNEFFTLNTETTLQVDKARQ